MVATRVEQLGADIVVEEADGCVIFRVEAPLVSELDTVDDQLEEQTMEEDTGDFDRMGERA